MFDRFSRPPSDETQVGRLIAPTTPMRQVNRFPLAPLLKLLVCVFFVTISCCAATPSPIEAPLKIDVPLAEIVSDLDRDIPVIMREAGVPGLSIALIRDGKL